MTERQPYNHLNCQSLFGYAAFVHERSGGVCELCGAGDPGDFDWWRQLTVEHLIGKSQGGYIQQIHAAVRARFPDIGQPGQAHLVFQLDGINTVTACRSCNSMTSRAIAEHSMTDMISGSNSTDDAIAMITPVCLEILKSKRVEIAWKLLTVRAAWDQQIAAKHRWGGDERLHPEYDV